MINKKKFKIELWTIAVIIFLGAVAPITVVSADTIVTTSPEAASRQELQNAVSSIMANILALQNSFSLNQAQTQATLSSIDAQINTLKSHIDSLTISLSNDTNRITMLEQLQKGK